MPWPQQRRLLGTKVPRLDGPEKSTGRARYTFDINRPGMAHAKILRCPHAHARIRTIDTAAAQKAPGFRAVQAIANAGNELFFAGAAVVAIACDTEEHCDDAMRLIRVDYEVLPFQVREEDGIRLRNQAGTAAAALMSNVQQNHTSQSDGFNDNVWAGLTTHEGTYGAAVICHQCLESHGIVCEWNEAQTDLTVWASTQAVPGTSSNLAQGLQIPAARVRCITHYMGGGFGSKFGNEVENLVCARLARTARAPVKLMLDRAEEVTTGGIRPSVYGRVKIGANAQGQLQAFDVDCHGTSGPGAGTSVNTALLPYVYVNTPNYRRRSDAVRLNGQNARAMRAPGHPQSCIMTDQPFDDLAARLRMDPLEMRLRNLPPNDQNAMQTAPTSWPAMRNTIYTRQLQLMRQLANWNQRWHQPGTDQGVIKTGMGLGMHYWQGGGNAATNQVRVTISNDGSVLVESSTQDLGTGNRTVLAIIVAEILGLEVRDITVRIGESQYGLSNASGGSTTCPSISPAALHAAESCAGRVVCRDRSPDGGPGGRFVHRAGRHRQSSQQFADAVAASLCTYRHATRHCTTDRPTPCGSTGRGQRRRRRRRRAVRRIRVDTETGVVRCTKYIAIQDVGLVVNKLACESQLAGGVIMGINYALYEERVMDARTGRQCNADMEFYKLGGIQDMPHMILHMMDMPERGVIGIGEPATVSTCAAVGNAIFNAIGRRVPHAPFTPERVLAALAAK